jgi:energy-coupling factor transporter ATP-binding protein EcfA2
VSNKIDLKNAPEIANIINQLDSAALIKKKFATFHKIAVHIHTPQSYDYNLIKTCNNSDIDENDLINIAKQYKILPKQDYLLNDFNDKTFDSSEEELKFLIQAKCIVNKGIEAVIITDHNQLGGSKKMIRAMRILKRYGVIQKCCSVISGIEISCADKNHVVGIFDDKATTTEKIQNWHRDFIMDRVSGTYKTAIDVLKMINEIGGIGYIAHINTNSILFGKDSLSKGYKRELFNLPFMQLFGLKDLSQTEYIQNKISEFRQVKGRLVPILEDDSHSLDDLGKRTFWIKAEHINFKAIRDALREFSLSTEIDGQPYYPKYYIKSFYCEGRGFLTTDPEFKKSGFSLALSERMNAFIGGRGTGKSTILDMIALLLSQQQFDELKLKYLLEQGTFAVLVHASDKEYYIMFNGSNGSEEDKMNDKEFIENYFFNIRRFSSDERKARKDLTRMRIQIFEKTAAGKILEITAKQKILDSLYTRQFSINTLVDVASGDKLTNFVNDLLSQSSNLNNLKKITNPDDISATRSLYKSIPQKIEQRKCDLGAFIDAFNKSESEQIKLEYSFKKIEEFEFPWNEFFDVYSDNDARQWFQNYNISKGKLVSYFRELNSIKDAFALFFLLIDSKFAKVNKLLSVADFLEKDAKIITDNDLLRITEKINSVEFFKEIQRRVKLKQGLISKALLRYINDFDVFHLAFNVNNKANYKSVGTRFVDVTNLSMGQKVVAMVSFILAYDNFTDTLNPLVIDQPEDNLDNQYIYYNLVRDLKEIRGKRQVIIASHNSTIVMNSGTEQVVVMESDGQNGWIDKTGYAMNSAITKRVINILEGGEEAFNKKAKIYGLD